MGKPVPYRYITDLPKQAQVEIERDFASLSSQISDSSIFDAIIDPTLSASDSSLHQYVNLTELVANESWDAGVVFHVGVKQPQGTTITEPADTLSIVGLGDLVLFGLLGQGPVTGGWEWAMLTAASTQTVVYHNIIINPTGTAF